MLSARQALRPHAIEVAADLRHRRSCRYPRRDYFDDVDTSDVVSGTDLLLLLQLICTVLICTVVVKQADLQQCQILYTVCMYKPLPYAAREVD